MFIKKLLHLACVALCLAAVPAPVSSADGTQHETGESIRGFSFAMVEDANQRSIVEGADANMISENLMLMTDVVCSIYQNGQQTLVITTPQAQADMDKSIVTSEQKVVFTNPKGMNINGTGMHWDTRARTITILKNIDSVFPSTMFAEVAPDDKK